MKKNIPLFFTLLSRAAYSQQAKLALYNCHRQSDTFPFKL